MICIYDQKRMIFNDADDTFICPNCKGELKIIQHPYLTTASSLVEHDVNLGGERPADMETFNSDGISTSWYRGNK